MNRYYLLLIIFGVIILIFITTIVVFNLTTPSTEDSTIIPTQTPIVTTFPFEEKSDPPVQYDELDQQKLLQKVEQRVPLSNDDAAARGRILSTLPAGEQSGILYQSQNIIIDYTQGPDIFQVEILTENIDTNKKEAVNWFLSQGMSQNAICNYPVHFYLNYELAQALASKNITFSPLAPGCN